MHPALEAIKITTAGTVFENDLFLVGGAVRDQELGLEVGNDFDLVTRQSAIELASLLFAKGLSSHAPVTYPRFGTAMLNIKGAAIELVTARKESYESNSRKPTVTPASYLEDAQRRDFTINTLMRGLHDDQLRDPLGAGLRDLKGKILRTPVDPAATFSDDPLRMLRAIRFSAKLGFQYAPGLVKGIKTTKDRLRVISKERIRYEFLKMLVLPAATRCLKELLEFKLLAIFAPEFLPMVGCEQGRFHHLDVWDHTLLAIENLQDKTDLPLVLAALFHDIGKPPTRKVDKNMQTRFFGHEVVGASIARKVLTRLKLPTRDIDPVVILVRNHMRLGTAHQFSAAAARRLIRDLGEEVERLLWLVEADAASLRPGVRALDLAPIRKRIQDVQAVSPRSELESPLTGSEIMTLFAVPAGPEVGRLKNILVEAVLDGTITVGDKEAAFRYIKNVNLNL